MYGTLCLVLMRIEEIRICEVLTRYELIKQFPEKRVTSDGFPEMDYLCRFESYSKYDHKNEYQH